MNTVFPLDLLPEVRRMWLRGSSAQGIARALGRGRSVADIQALIDHNRSGNTWPENRMEFPAWIDAC